MSTKEAAVVRTRCAIMKIPSTRSSEMFVDVGQFGVSSADALGGSSLENFAESLLRRRGARRASRLLCSVPRNVFRSPKSSTPTLGARGSFTCTVARDLSTYSRLRRPHTFRDFPQPCDGLHPAPRTLRLHHITNSNHPTKFSAVSKDLSVSELCRCLNTSWAHYRNMLELERTWCKRQASRGYGSGEPE